MSFLGGILGVSGQKGTPSQVVDVTPEQFERLQEPIATRLLSMLQGNAGTPSLAGIPSVLEGGKTGKDLTAQLGGQEQQLINLLVGMSSNNPQLQQAGNIFSNLNLPNNPLLGTSQDLLKRTMGGEFLRPESNPFLASAIETAQRPVIENFERVINPQLRAAFTNAGHTIQAQGSSPFAHALAQSGSDFANTLGDIASNLSYANYSAERDRQMGAVNQGIGLRGQEVDETLRTADTKAQGLLDVNRAQLDTAIEGLRAAQLPRLIEQMGLDKGTEEFNRRVNLLLQAIQMAQGSAGPNPVKLEGTAGTAPDGLLQNAGGIASLATAAMSLFSDRRLKTDIQRVGSLPSGIGVYEFRYRHGTKRFRGVMADEVLGRFPEAVGTALGYLTVDYSQVR